MARLSIALLMLCVAASARAQSAYVAGTLGADVTRVTHTDSTFYSSPSSDNETISWSLRVGSAVGQNWGVELEFVHSGRTHGQLPSPVAVPLASNYSITTTLPSLTGFTFNSLSDIASIVPFQADVRQNHTDLDPLVWVRQPLGGTVDLVYLGGMVFSRQRIEVTQNFPTALRLLAPIPNGRFRSVVVSYGTRPLAGVEARVRFTSHVRLVPGVRLQGIAEGWLLRPYVGLGWFF